jgi:membrane protease subunit HflK
LPHAQADAASLVDEAKSYSDQVVARAQGDAERFKQVYEQYSKAPAVIRERMYLDTMQHIYSNSTKVFVDSKASNNVMYLPLDKLVEATRQHAEQAAAASGASGAVAAVAPQAASAASASGGAANAVSAADAASAASAASDADAASDPLRSRDAFRSRGREDDIQ